MSNATHQAEEAVWLNGQAPQYRALWAVSAKLWDAGRDLVAAFQIHEGKHLDLIVPPWEDLPMGVRLSFHMTMGANSIHAQVSTTVAALSKLML